MILLKKKLAIKMVVDVHDLPKVIVHIINWGDKLSFPCAISSTFRCDFKIGDIPTWKYLIH